MHVLFNENSMTTHNSLTDVEHYRQNIQGIGLSIQLKVSKMHV